ncbi:MAG TPA: hypothetical protein VKY41_06950 [Xanthomarina sp.]|nr:hypothetical protein [Xanthomarina sp.]
MKNLLYIFLFSFTMSLVLPSCRDQKSNDIEDVADDVGDAVEDVADDVGDIID